MSIRRLGLRSGSQRPVRNDDTSFLAFWICGLEGDGLDDWCVFRGEGGGLDSDAGGMTLAVAQIQFHLASFFRRSKD